jgi:hypothetical protein
VSYVHRFIFLAAAITGITAAANVPAAPPQTGTKPAPAAPQPEPTRAVLVKNLDANFKSIDTNGDGTLSQAELAAAQLKTEQQRLALIRSRLEAEFAKLDANHDGTLSKAEFMAAAPETVATPTNGAALQSQFDKNKDGKITIDEYRAPVVARFDQADTNHDGVLSAAERQAIQANRRH